MFCAIFLLLLLAPAASLEIVCGDYHNCVFERGQEAMKCWGENGDQRLGYDDTNDRGDAAGEMGSNLPLLNIGAGFTVEAMSLCLQHSCAMSDDRAAKCFGSNAYSQLGFDGLTTTGDALPFLEFGVDFNLSKIAVGTYHTCALSTDAQVKCFGYNYYGQCGAGIKSSSSSPISGPPSQITAIDFGTNFTPVDVHTFHYHVCVLSQQQTVKCFGDNWFGQLGYGDATDRGSTPESMGDGLPIVDLGSDFIVAAMATGYFHSCALSTTKTVKCWGDNRSGQCGTPHSSETGDNLPVLEFGADFVPMQLALGELHTCILSEDATLICFGNNQYGQLGIGSNTSVDTPSTLTGIDLGSNFVPRQVAAGGYHTCAVSTGDAIKCLGRNHYGRGQLGLGHTDVMSDGPNEMGDNLPFVDVDWPSAAPTIATSAPTTAPTTAAPTTSKQPTVSPTTTTSPTTAPTATPSTTATNVPTTQPTTKQPSTVSPTTASPSTTMASTHAPSTSSPTPPPVTVSTAALTTTTTTLVAPTVAETTASPAATTSSISTQTIVVIAACASALFVAAVCICAAAFYYVRKHYVRRQRRLSDHENVAKAQQVRDEICIDNDAEVRVPPGVVAYARENAHVEDTRGEDNHSLPAQESVLSVDAGRRENIELAIAEVRVVAPGVVAYERGEDNLSLPAQESVLCVDEGIAQNEGRRQSRVSQLQNHGGDATALHTTVATSGATAGIDPSLGVYELNLMVDL